VTFTALAAGGDLAWLDGVTGVRSIAWRGDRVEVSGEGPLLARVAAALAERGLEPEDLDVRRGTLEEVYLAVAGGAETGSVVA
jgi:hypothetical protein